MQLEDAHKNRRARADQVLRKIAGEVSDRTEDTERVIIHFLQSGEVAYRVYAPGDDDYEGGVLAAP